MKPGSRRGASSPKGDVEVRRGRGAARARSSAASSSRGHVGRRPRAHDGAGAARRGWSRRFEDVPRDADRVIFFPRRRRRARRRVAARRPGACSRSGATGDRRRRPAVGPRAARRSRRPSSAAARAARCVPGRRCGYDPGRERRAEQRARELLQLVRRTRRSGGCTATSGSSASGAAEGPGAATGAALGDDPPRRRPLRLPRLPAQADRRRTCPQTARPAQRVLRRVPRRDAAVRQQLALPDSDDVPRQVDGADGRRAPTLIGRGEPATSPAARSTPSRSGATSGASAQWERERAPRTPPGVPLAVAAAVRRVARPCVSANRLRPQAPLRAAHRGSERAAARAYLKGIGYDDEALREAAHRRGPRRGSRPCRATSTCARSPSTSRRASATPAARRWSSTRSRSPTASRWAPTGMKTSPRLRARSSPTRSSSSRRGHLFDARGRPGGLRQDDPRHA